MIVYCEMKNLLYLLMSRTFA